MKLSQTCKKYSITRPKDTETVCMGNYWKFIWGVRVLEQWVAASLPHPNLLWPSCSMLAPVAAKGNRKHAKMRATSPAASKVLVTKVPSKCKKGGNSKVEKGQPHGKTIQLKLFMQFPVSPIIGRMPHSDSSARKHSIAFHSSHHYIHNSCCGWVTNLWKTSNWTGSRRAIPADSCLQHGWQQIANPATPPIFLISLLFLMLCGAFTKKKKLPVRTGTSWTQWPMATSKWERGRLIRSCQDS